MTDLNQFAASSSKFVTSEDWAQGFLVAKYMGYSIYPKTFQGQTNDVVGYKLILRGLDKEKVMESTSGKLASMMARVPVGTVVKIEKSGQGFSTTWKVTMAGNAPIAKEPELPVIEQNDFPPIADNDDFAIPEEDNSQININDIPF